MSVNLLTEHHLEFLSLEEAAQARLSLHLSNCHIVGNHMSRLKLSLSTIQASPATPDMMPSQMQGNPHFGPMIAGNPFEDHRGFPPNSMPYSPNSMSGMPNSMSG